MSKAALTRRYLTFSGALFVSAFGVSLITRSLLGTSPISSIPYVMSINTPLTMGSYIIIFNMVLIALQMLMLGRVGIIERKIDLLMQIPVSILFGIFIDMTMWLLGSFVLTLYFVKIISLIFGCAILATGICLEVIADVTMLSGEYTVQIASKYFKKEFGNVKVAFDISLVVIAILSSLLLSGAVDGIREGTIIAALLTGPFVRLILPRLSFIKEWQMIKAECKLGIENFVGTPPFIVTISREYGSGGHAIGRLIAQELGVAFYDKELIDLAAKESNLSDDFVRNNEQRLSGSLLSQMIMQDYEVPLEKSLSSEDALFVAQSRVIRRISSQSSCVIVGRCADYILNDRPNVINIFLHSDMKHKVERVVGQYGLSVESAHSEINKIDKARKDHYHHYTGQQWGDARNYDLSFDTSRVTTIQIAEMVKTIYVTHSSLSKCLD